MRLNGLFVVAAVEDVLVLMGKLFKGFDELFNKYWNKINFLKPIWGKSKILVQISIRF